MADIRFETEGEIATLAQLLTVQGWLPATASRLTFFNSRTREFDRLVGHPALVLADGPSAFLEVVTRTECEESDVIAVIHKAIEHDRLETVGVQLASLAQWYSPTAPETLGLTQPPPGMDILVLERNCAC